ncbi:MAG: hypothetical protein ABI595_13595 [Actinomycetota bacterium]
MAVPVKRNRRLVAGVVGVIEALGMGSVLNRSLTSDPISADRSVEPAPAPATSGPLAFTLDGDICVADPDGSNAVKITNAATDAGCEGRTGEYDGPSWSPDGRYLAYDWDCSSSEWWGVVVVSDSKGNVLATFPGARWRIAWTPDSTCVAVWDTVFETIGVYGVDGTRQTQLTIPPGMIESGDHDPVWMLGGTSLMVPNVEVPLSGSAPRPLPLPARAGSITYSPDGSRVVYVTRRSLTVARSDGSEPREVFGDWTGDLAWSATGDRLAFISNGPDDARSAELRELDVATGSVTMLTEGEPGASLQAIGYSPNGGRILFSKDGGRGQRSRWSLGVDGSDPRLVVAGGCGRVAVAMTALWTAPTDGSARRRTTKQEKVEIMRPTDQS